MAGTRLIIRLVGVAVAAVAVTTSVGACSSETPDVRSMTLTLVRNGQSAGNAAGIIDTAVPGPALTDQGRQQAQQLVSALAGEDYDGVYASTMDRAQQTAAPLARALGEQVEVVQGIQEINAGWLEGKPDAEAGPTYLLAPMAWLQGDRASAVPGSISGNTFNDDFTGAVQKVYDSGESNAIVFSHNAAIMTWTLMNTRNPKLSLFTTHPLPDTGRVVIRGNPQTGWELLDWDGITDFTA